MLQWIRDFLRNKTQQVALNGQKSGSISVTSGVPCRDLFYLQCL